MREKKRRVYCTDERKEFRQTHLYRRRSPTVGVAIVNAPLLSKKRDNKEEFEYKENTRVREKVFYSDHRKKENKRERNSFENE